MKYLTSAILAATVALSSVPALASDPQGADIEASSQLTNKECLTMQAAKNDGTSRVEMKKACKWTTDAHGATNLPRIDKPRPVDSAPYGLLPGATTPPP